MSRITGIEIAEAEAVKRNKEAKVSRNMRMKEKNVLPLASF